MVIADVFPAGSRGLATGGNKRRATLGGSYRHVKVGTTTCERVGTNLIPPNRLPAITSLPFDLTKPEGIRSKARDATVFV